MKRPVLVVSLLMTACFSVAACVDEGPTEEDVAPSLSEEHQEVEVCPAAYGCVLTAIRDGNSWLIDTCIEVLCQTPQQQ